MLADNITTIAPHHKRLEAPAPLRELPGWLCWRYELLAGESKPRKVPYYASGSRRAGQQGSPEDRARLVTFAAAKAAAVRLGMEGVGLAMLGDWGVVALDFDHCVGPGGELPEAIKRIAQRTYSEYSPSGTGLRVFLKGDLGNRKARAKDGQHGTETFSSSGFVTFTGNALPHVEIIGYEDKVADVDDFTRTFCEERLAVASQPAVADDFMAGFEPKLGLSIGEMESLLDQLDPDMGREDWVRVGMALHHEAEGDDTGFDIWNDWSSNGGKYPGEEALREQWDSFTRRMGPGRKQITMASVIYMTKQADLRLEPTVEQITAKAEALASTALATTGAVCTNEDFEGKFPVWGARQAYDRPGGAWYIKGLLPDADLAIVYGASGAGKSFVAFDMAAALARGIPWRGRRTRETKVLMVVAEGSGGVSKRLKAYCQKEGIDIEALNNLGFIYDAPNILDAEDVTQIAASIRASGAEIVIWDTFAQVTPGANENAGEDMGRALANLRMLRAATGAMNVLVHHAGKDLSRGSRGWSGLKAAADAEIEVSRDEVANVREIRVSKMKDGEDGVRWGFNLETVTVGMDADGDEETSCVVVEADTRKAEIEPGRGTKRRGRIENHVLEMLETFGERDIVPLAELIDAAVAALPAPEAGKRDTRRQTVVRAVESLSKEKDGPMQVKGNVVVLYE